jgi:dynein heavy chain
MFFIIFKQEKNWEVVEITKSKVDRFRRTMPLVNDLHNKAMRERHWSQIKVNFGFEKDFFLLFLNFFTERV